LHFRLLKDFRFEHGAFIPVRRLWEMLKIAGIAIIMGNFEADFPICKSKQFLLLHKIE